jgi:hypothetical protein
MEPFWFQIRTQHNLVELDDTNIWGRFKEMFQNFKNNLCSMVNTKTTLHISIYINTKRIEIIHENKRGFTCPELLYNCRIVHRITTMQLNWLL